MARVLSHVHFCLACNELWICVRWACMHEGKDLVCELCHNHAPLKAAPDEQVQSYLGHAQD
jgi:hypothetical protein